MHKKNNKKKKRSKKNNCEKTVFFASLSVIHVVGGRSPRIAPAGQHSFEEMSPFYRVIEIYDYLKAIIYRQQSAA